MNPTLRNILALILGLVLGMGLNMTIIIIGPNIIPPPEGVNPEDFETVKANIHLYSFKQLMVPFLAHALGTLIGAFMVAKIAVSNKKIFAYVIGFLFLAGGIYMVVEIPNTPLWFILLDLIGAYIPMAWLGLKLARK